MCGVAGGYLRRRMTLSLSQCAIVLVDYRLVNSVVSACVDVTMGLVSS